MTVAVVTTARSSDQVALPQARLPDDMRRNPGITGIGEIAVTGPADEPTVTRWIEPPGRYGIRYNRRRRRLWLNTRTASTTTVTTMAAAVAIVAIVAVRAVVAIVLVVAFLPMGVMSAGLTLESLLVVLRRGLRLARLTFTHWC